VAALPSRISRYEVLDRLGEGGMGVLYLARDPRLDRTVAIKVLSDYSAELHERFAREARSAAALKHPHIITIYDVGEDEGRPFLAMEYIDGETLGELIRRRPLLTVARKLQILRELCSGLSYAHRRGIIHRDIKPANVMITSEGSIKILDFGLARIMTEMTNAGLTQTGALMGTPHYMAPEQVDGKRADERSDIFAVGVVMYELLSYQKAFSGNSPHVVLHRIMTTEPPPLGEVCPDLDPELERIVHRAIEKDPDRRYQDLVALGADLSHVFERLTEGLSEPTVRVERAPGTRGDDPPSPARPPRHGLLRTSIRSRSAARRRSPNTCARDSAICTRAVSRRPSSSASSPPCSIRRTARCSTSYRLRTARSTIAR
jgi:serine/threonine-protein kinase